MSDPPTGGTPALAAEDVCRDCEGLGMVRRKETLIKGEVVYLLCAACDGYGERQ